jgi:cytochrome c peroxidase
MKSNSIIVLLLVAAGSLSTTFFVNEPVLPPTPYDYASLNLPAHFTTNANGPLPTSINGIDNTPADNPITNHGATLGRVLFYDKTLSANGTISCSSCHKAANGFSDPAVLSKGFEGGLTRRHSMTLINARWYQRGRAFWDERAATLEQQVLMPFQDDVEMGLTLPELLEKVSEQPYYSQLFTNAFGDNTVTSDRISKALAQFVRSIVSYQSKYDIGRAMAPNPGAPFSNFTAQENTGKGLFFQTIPNGGGACFGCHTTEAFVSANPGPQNNGLDAASTTDLGAGEVFPNPIFVGRFKTSSLRNIELTAPYMHDGRFATLEQVVEHYNSGIKAHPTLSPALTGPNGAPVTLNFSSDQKAALVAFLKTLTDPTIATEPKWSDPFPASSDVASVLMEPSFRLYPNPTADFLTVEMPDFVSENGLFLSVWNQNGQLALSKSLLPVGVQTVDLSRLTAGVYYTELRGVRGNSYGTRQVVLQR